MAIAVLALLGCTLLVGSSAFLLWARQLNKKRTAVALAPLKGSTTIKHPSAYVLKS
jgi:hypothetical protein